MPNSYAILAQDVLAILFFLVYYCLLFLLPILFAPPLHWACLREVMQVSILKGKKEKTVGG